jgi:hypothetical protein
MTARYLVRLDDACATMDHRRWAALEQVLDRHGVKPIVAVVPDNRDPALAVAERDERFWDKVRLWVAKGWILAMHGGTHVMQPTSAELLVPFYQRSEFAGRTLEDQSARIRSAWALFLEQGVTPRVWVAPAHSFDALTLQALRAETSIEVVSDGIAFDTYSELGFRWIPQQLWSFSKRPFGVWTICLHPNQMSTDDHEALDRTLSSGFGRRIARFDTVRLSPNAKGLLGRLYHQYFWWRWRNRPKDPAINPREHNGY